ncbi:FadR/GntR family transcriptional regulator [Thalassotalea mangrovi]|uniref:FadR family transcriptional regulator n=1 Tax=Thalassotalea mangrovi TaxID=2572245 RepID=A0A4U1B347_9GAMM|nr:FadR/GntR family transcriptional regulator [Thalassotalea mangrovi]TKB43827.1 FadR family transcriptional regulator [Thalassotalea mangrovi]
MANTKSNRPISIHKWVTGELGARIVGGEYRPGDYIPNETNLGEELGVSRTALREAFKTLTAKGLIESRPKLGTRITEKKHWNMFDSDVLEWFFRTEPSIEFYHSLFAIRGIFEPAAAKLAAQNRTQEQVVQLAEAYEKMEKASIGTDDVFTSDLEFHMTILEATNNEFVISLGKTIQTALAGIFKLSSSTEQEYIDALPGHKAIYQAIANKDADGAEQQMLVLLDESEQSVKEALER